MFTARMFPCHQRRASRPAMFGPNVKPNMIAAYALKRCDLHSALPLARGMFARIIGANATAMALRNQYARSLIDFLHYTHTHALSRSIVAPIGHIGTHTHIGN